MSARVHAFTDDVLADHDATALAALLRSHQVKHEEVVEAAIARAERLQPVVNGVHFADYERARTAPMQDGVFGGVPTFVKDNVDVLGLPTNHGSAAFTADPAEHDGPFVTQYRALGFTLLGKSRLPEFGFSASTEYAGSEPVRNPWNPDYSAGASSGGSAALVAAGVVPIAHANDGGGSIRIPAAACGLVGLAPTRRRLVPDASDRVLPVDIIRQGVVTRSVRDTARFHAAAEQVRPARRLPGIGMVTGPAERRLRIALITESPASEVDAQTRRTVEQNARLLEELGHRVEPADPPVDARFGDDFARYWSLLALLISLGGRRVMHRDFDAAATENLTQGLAGRARRELRKLPGTILRLRATTALYRQVFQEYDVVLSPVLTHTTPLLGHLDPTLEFEELFDRLHRYVGFTPLNNTSGGPAISLPMGMTDQGLPIGCHFSADLGDERTLLELAYELEQARPWRRIQDA